MDNREESLLVNIAREEPKRSSNTMKNLVKHKDFNGIYKIIFCIILRDSDNFINILS